jgi:hypothetical protein
MYPVGWPHVLDVSLSLSLSRVTWAYQTGGDEWAMTRWAWRIGE